MLKTIEPGLGDILDRLFIVKRKLIEGQKMVGGKTYYTEEAQLIGLVADHYGGTVGGQLSAILQLAAVNATIWERTDAARSPMCEERLTLAHSLIDLNDSRHHVVDMLNREGSEGRGRKGKGE